jgi:N utilization substance protein B
MPGMRRQARILALQLLYQTEIDPDGAETAEARFWARTDASKRVRPFAETLYRETTARREPIDALLTECLDNWKLSRLPVLVRNLLRLAVCEMIHLRDDPHAVIIDEAVTLAREYVDEESARFANGVLQRCWDRSGGVAGDGGPDGDGPGSGGALDPPTAP